MDLNFKLVLFIITVFIVLNACNSDPKVISASSENGDPEKSTGIFSSEPSVSSVSEANTSFEDDLHAVIVKEVLPATRYVYLYVEEGDGQFWIATTKQKYTKGGTYYYKGGLLKTNFESKEYNRIFDTIYLVSNVVASNHGTDVNNDAEIDMEPQMKVKPVVDPNLKIEKAGSIKISELVKNKEKYNGKTVQVSGKCVKINPGIMNRNWIHIADGSQNDFDLVITSDTFVQEGSIVTMRAVVGLNRDFGAGYKYDLILENGTVVP
jgi:autonomous glycyl radical cofactor GrcA